jgi:hypothetical protein
MSTRTLYRLKVVGVMIVALLLSRLFTSTIFFPNSPTLNLRYLADLPEEVADYINGLTGSRRNLPPRVEDTRQIAQQPALQPGSTFTSPDTPAAPAVIDTAQLPPPPEPNQNTQSAVAERRTQLADLGYTEKGEGVYEKEDVGAHVIYYHYESGVEFRERSITISGQTYTGLAPVAARQ